MLCLEFWNVIGWVDDDVVFVELMYWWIVFLVLFVLCGGWDGFGLL